MGQAPEWSELYAARRRMAQRWPNLFRLAVRKSPGRVVAAACSAGAAVLDVGAGARRLKESIARHGPGVTYKSADPDPAHPHEFDSVAAALAGGEQFDVVACLEVIEHLPLGEGLQLLRDVAALLKPGGVCVLSTPNVWTPGQFLRDATHVTPWAYDELAGACALSGLEPEAICRTWNAAALPRLVRLWLAAPLHRYFGIDFAHSICVTARKREAE